MFTLILEEPCEGIPLVLQSFGLLSNGLRGAIQLSDSSLNLIVIEPLRNFPVRSIAQLLGFATLL